MPAGCDFICNNEECEHKQKGFTITALWPLGDIDLVIKARNVEKDEDFRKGLTSLKEKGREYACINYPNVDHIPTVGIRVHKWCTGCKCLWMYDVMLGDNTDFEKALKDSDVPDKCSKCNNDLLGFEKIIEDKICCPHCDKELQSNRWFSNETYKEL